MATIKDVARMAGVAPSTISKYINGGNVRKENLEAIEKANGGSMEKGSFLLIPKART